MKNSDKKLHHLHFAGYDFTSGRGGTKIQRTIIDLKSDNDYGADPLPDGNYKMVPSGEIVSLEEKNKRLSHLHKK